VWHEDRQRGREISRTYTWRTFRALFEDLEKDYEVAETVDWNANSFLYL